MTGTTFDIAQHRHHFEDQCWTYYETYKNMGWASPEEGDSTRESLFWRTEDGRYGVHSVEQAWQGFIMGAKHYYPTLAARSGALIELGNFYGLPADVDLTTMLLPVTRSMAETGRHAVKLLMDILNARSVDELDNAQNEARQLLQKILGHVAAGRPQ